VQEIADRFTEVASLDTLGLVCYVLGDYSTAQEYGERAFALEKETDDLYMQAYTLNHLGLNLAAVGKLAEAQKALQQALAMRGELDQQPLELDDLAGLARIALAQNHVPQALFYLAQLEKRIETININSAEFPIWVYLTLFQLLAMAGDQRRAQQVLQGGYQLLQERANRIQDESLRQQYLSRVPFNRGLLEAWEQNQGIG
jgi:tetratricopeptide (TPR) repeat protein